MGHALTGIMAYQFWLVQPELEFYESHSVLAKQNRFYWRIVLIVEFNFPFALLFVSMKMCLPEIPVFAKLLNVELNCFHYHAYQILDRY